nr:MAG TPA: hypothetical protein [Caudoviricetes sp.]
MRIDEIGLLRKKMLKLVKRHLRIGLYLIMQNILYKRLTLLLIRQNMM